MQLQITPSSLLSTYSLSQEISPEQNFGDFSLYGTAHTSMMNCSQHSHSLGSHPTQPCVARDGARQASPPASLREWFSRRRQGPSLPCVQHRWISSYSLRMCKERTQLGSLWLPGCCFPTCPSPYSHHPWLDKPNSSTAGGHCPVTHSGHFLVTHGVRHNSTWLDHGAQTAQKIWRGQVTVFCTFVPLFYAKCNKLAHSWWRNICSDCIHVHKAKNTFSGHTIHRKDFFLL